MTPRRSNRQSNRYLRHKVTQGRKEIIWGHDRTVYTEAARYLEEMYIFRILLLTQDEESRETLPALNSICRRCGIKGERDSCFSTNDRRLSAVIPMKGLE